MDSNIIDLDNSNNILENYSHTENQLRINKIFKNVFKFSAYFIGILILGLFVNDLGHNIDNFYLACL